MSDAQPVRTRPAVTEDNAYFWEGVEAQELRIQECLSCHTLVHPPRPACATCGSLELGYRVASGKGHVFSYVTMHKPLVPPYTEPYDVAVIELDEGVRMISQVIGIAADEVHIDLPVEVSFEQVEADYVLPLFVPRTDGD